MSDYRIGLAIDFAERMCALQDMPAMRACKLAATVYDLDADALLTAWLRRLIEFRGPVPLPVPAVEAAQS